MNGTAFVTGAGGFVGARMASYCEALGLQTVRIGHRAKAGKISDGVFFDADIGLKSLESAANRYGAPSVLYHCAGGASVRLAIENPAEDFRRNVQILSEVLEFSRRLIPRIRVVVLSSAAVYGDVGKGGAKREDMPLAPLSPYGLHKCLAEDLCRFYAAYWKLPIAVIRFFSLYGEGLRKQLLWDACKKLHGDAFIFEGTGNEERDWLHVEDAVRLIALAGEHASSLCPIVNGGSGAARSVRSVLEALGALRDPAVLPRFSGRERSGDPYSLVADVQRSRTWGFSPKVDFMVGLESYWDWFEREVGTAC